jgi:hypothetical protein
MNQSGNDADEIRRQMAQIRVGLHQDVSGVVGSAERVMDWRSYLRNAAWLSVGLAFAVGYFVVPRRRASAGVSTEQQAAEPRFVSRPPDNRGAATNVPRTDEREGPGLARKLLSLAWPVAVSAAQSYAAAWIEQLIAGQTATLRQSAHPSPPPGQRAASPPRPPGQPQSSARTSL